MTITISRRSFLIMMCGALALLAASSDHAASQAEQKHAEANGQTAHVRAPISEVLHCPLAFAGVHLQKDKPTNAQTAYHFCKPLSDDVAQCLLYDSTAPNARLIGIEYLVSDEIYQKMPPEERTFWHDHKYEVDARLIRSLTQSGDEEAKTLAKVRTLWGKVYHTWVEGKEYPTGPAKLFWSVTGEKPLVLPPGAKLPSELKATPHAESVK